MNPKIRRQLRRGEREIARRLDKVKGGRAPAGPGPEFSGRARRYEVSDRVRAIPYGGLPVLHEFVRGIGLVDRIDRELQVLKMHRPYRDSDHVLNIAFNALCGGRSLEDIEVRRNDVAFLDALGARTIPDPTTAGDYCRRFAADGGEALWVLQQIFNDVRVDVWNQQRSEFRKETARIDADGTFVTTTGACKEGMDMNYKREWGFHALLISLANTSEPLFIYHRPGSRPSYEGAAPLLD